MGAPNGNTSPTFHIQYGQRKPFFFLQEHLACKRLPTPVPVLPRVPAQGQEAYRAPGIHTGMARHHAGPRSHRAAQALPSLQMLLSYTLLNLSSNTNEASSGFNCQKHLLLWARELLPALPAFGIAGNPIPRALKVVRAALVLPCSGIATLAVAL